MQFSGLFLAGLARAAVVALLASSTLSLSAQAQNGTLRERLAERRAQAASSPGAAADELAAANEGPAARFALPAGARLLADLPYGADARQRMDVYLPASAQDAPVIFMVHGGGWRTGDKTGRGVARHKVERWVARGIIVVSTNYRLLPEADPAVQADDVARALAFAQKAAAGWGGDAARFVLMGHSAGAHLVALLNAGPQRALALGAQPWRGAVALDSAVMDVEQSMRGRHLPMYDNAFGRDPAFWRQVSPQAVWTPGAPPLLVVCSTLRRDKPCDAGARLAAHAGALGSRVQVLGQPLKHGEINDQLGTPGAYTDAVEGFLGGLDARLMAQLRR